MTSSPLFTKAIIVLHTDCLAPLAQLIWAAVYSSPFSFFSFSTMAFRNAG